MPKTFKIHDNQQCSLCSFSHTSREKMKEHSAYWHNGADDRVTKLCPLLGVRENSGPANSIETTSSPTLPSEPSPTVFPLSSTTEPTRPTEFDSSHSTVKAVELARARD